MKSSRLALIILALMMFALVPATLAFQTEAGSLPGTQWRLVSYGVPGAETPVAQAGSITLVFPAANEVAGSGGCNEYSGTYGVAQADIVFNDIVSTLRACADDTLTQQEQDYLDALRTASSYALTGNQLTIWYADGQRRLNFVTTGVEADILEGSEWQLEAYGDPDTPIPVIPDSNVTINFQIGNRVEGHGGCNGYGGNFQTAGNSISFSQIVHTEIACVDPLVTAQEQAFFDALQTATEYQGFFDRLIITYADGQQLNFTIIPNEATPEPPFPTECAGTWVVQSGDTLSAIARACDTTVDALLAANPEITDPSVIRVGQEITIPETDIITSG